MERVILYKICLREMKPSERDNVNFLRNPSITTHGIDRRRDKAELS